MFTIQYVKDLQWENAEHTFFSCVVKYEEFDEEHPSGINAIDPYAHIQEIWAKGNAGEYGVIAEYIPPPVPTEQELANAQAVTDARTSALTKLAALGLTQDEVKALIG
jgi:hypothetical protein